MDEPVLHPIAVPCIKRKMVESVKCPYCGFNNPDGSKFCGRCGRVFQVMTRPRKKKKIIAVLAVVVVAIILVAAISAISFSFSPSGDSSKPVLYAHILFNVDEMATTHPRVQLSVDTNGDGIYETIQNYTPTMTTMGNIYLQTNAQSAIFKLNSSASTFSYRIQVFSGTSTLYYIPGQPYDTFTGAIKDDTNNTENFTPTLNNTSPCYLLTSYFINQLDTDNSTST
jgi:uncharacterized Zn-finger protein